MDLKGLGLLTGCMIAIAPEAACAAGGAHIVDDAEIEKPGICHVETWATRRSRETGVLVTAPACTPMATPSLELGISIVDALQPGHDVQTIAPSAKYVLRPSQRNWGVAVSGTALWSAQSHRVEYTAVIVPLTLAASKTVNLNFNAGWLWTRATHRSAGFLGAQVEWQARSKLGVMIEGFDRSDGVPGGQAGLRWSPVQQIDVDLLASHGFDGTAHANATIGLTASF